jgi:pimeloyl-ACP methyl ester carboxylesterase
MYLVAVHGYLLDHRLWDPLSVELSRLIPGLRTVAPDLRGRGTSSLPAAAEHTMTLLAGDVAGEIDRLVPAGDPFVLAGLSMGGYVAFEFLKRNRARFRDRLQGLILCDTRAHADDDAGKANRLAAAEAIRAEGMDAALRTMLPRLIARKARGSEVEKVVRAMILETPPATACADLAGLRLRDDGFEALGAFDRPVLIVVGDEDLLTPPSDAEAMAELCVNAPGVGLVTIPEAGHLSPLEEPIEVASAFAAFLSRIRP